MEASGSMVGGDSEREGEIDGDSLANGSGGVVEAQVQERAREGLIQSKQHLPDALSYPPTLAS